MRPTRHGRAPRLLLLALHHDLRQRLLEIARNPHSDSFSAHSSADVPYSRDIALLNPLYQPLEHWWHNIHDTLAVFDPTDFLHDFDCACYRAI